MRSSENSTQALRENCHGNLRSMWTSRILLNQTGWRAQSKLLKMSVDLSLKANMKFPTLNNSDSKFNKCNHRNEWIVKPEKARNRLNDRFKFHIDFTFHFIFKLLINSNIHRREIPKHSIVINMKIHITFHLTTKSTSFPWHHWQIHPLTSLNYPLPHSSSDMIVNLYCNLFNRRRRL